MVSVTTMHSNFAGIVRIHSEVLHTPVWSLGPRRKLRAPGPGGHAGVLSGYSGHEKWVARVSEPAGARHRAVLSDRSGDEGADAPARLDFGHASSPRPWAERPCRRAFWSAWARLSVDCLDLIR